MRRVIGLVLIGLGVAALVAAPLLKWYAAPRLLKAPLDQFSETVSEASDVTYLDIAALEVKTGREFVATRTVRGDVAAGDADRAVYDVFVKIIDPEKAGEGEEQLVSANTDRVAFDRSTSEAINCCDENLNGEPTKHEGIEYKFPFGTEKKTYQYFDTSIAAATDMEFVQESELEGLTVYEFEQDIEPTKIAELDVPGDLVGRDEASLTVDRYYSNVRRVWVEPVTGIIVKGAESQLSTLRDGDEDLLTITEVDLEFNEATVKAQAAVAEENLGSARFVQTTGPLGLGVLGLVLVGAGILLARVPRDEAPRSRGRRAAPTAGDSPVVFSKTP
jgi:hypothetical protein